MDATGSSDAEHPSGHSAESIVVDDPQVASNNTPPNGTEPEPFNPPVLLEVHEEVIERESQSHTDRTVDQPATAVREIQQREAPTDESLPQDLPPAIPAKSSPPTSVSDDSATPPSYAAHLADRDGHDDRRPQTPASVTTPSSAHHKRSFTISHGHTVSVVLISSALETILASKEARRSAPLRDSAQKALEMIRAGEGGDKPREIFEPLRLACETRNDKLMIASLDCISKLISYSFFAEEGSNQSLPSPPPSPTLHARGSLSGSQTNIPQPSLVDLVVYTITSCHSETTPEAVSLQVVKALLALVLSPTIYVHHSSLLKVIRTVYNVFLLSTDPVNQMVAQGGLTQMVHHIFTRCRPGQSNNSEDVSSLRPSVSSDRLASSSSNVATKPDHSEVPERSHSVPEVDQGHDTMSSPGGDVPLTKVEVANADSTNGFAPPQET